MGHFCPPGSGSGSESETLSGSATSGLNECENIGSYFLPALILKEEAVGEEKEEAVGEKKEEAVGEKKEEAVGEEKEEAVGEEKEAAVVEEAEDSDEEYYEKRVFERKECNIFVECSEEESDSEGRRELLNLLIFCDAPFFVFRGKLYGLLGVGACCNKSFRTSFEKKV